jgi:Pectate lyase superfamily protein
MATPTGILFNDPQAKPLSTSGQFQPGSYYLFYLTGSTTPVNVYADGALTTPLSQTPGQAQPSCTADGFGRFNPIYMNPATIYRVQLYSSGGIKLEDVDPYVVPLSANTALFGATSVTAFGADPTGVANSSPAFNAALAASTIVYVPPGTYNMQSGITIPAGVSMYGLAFQPNNPPTGVVLSFALSVATCVTMGGPSTTNGSCSLKGVTITRATGTPPSGSIGLLNQNTAYTTIEDVACYSHQIPVEFSGNGASFGTICMVNRLYTGAAYDSHIVVNTMNEIRFNQCRFGMDGPGDQTCNSYVRITGGSTSNPAGGPNTLIWSNCQFNQGANSCSYGLSWQNMTVGNIADNQLWQMSDCYFEDVTAGFLHADASWVTTNPFGNFMFDNVFFNAQSTSFPLMSFANGIQLNSFSFSNCQCTGSLTLASTQQMNFFQISNCYFLGAVSITGAGTGGSFSSIGNIYDGGLTLAGNFGALTSVGDQIDGGAFVLTATSTANSGLQIAGLRVQLPWTPALSSASGSGITYSRQVGVYQITGNQVTVNFSIILTGLGTASGAVTLTGFPIASSANASAAGNGGVLANTANLTGTFTGPMLATMNSGATTAVLTTYTTSGPGLLTVAQLTATSAISGSFSYQWN